MLGVSLAIQWHWNNRYDRTECRLNNAGHEQRKTPQVELRRCRGFWGPLESQLMKLTTTFTICIRLAGLALAELTTEGKLLRDTLL